MAQNNKTGKAQEPFKPAPGDEAYVHVTLEQPNYDQRTGKRLSRPRMQKFGVREWAKVREQLYKQGYAVEVLYTPTAKPAQTLPTVQVPADVNSAEATTGQKPEATPGKPQKDQREQKYLKSQGEEKPEGDEDGAAGGGSENE